MLKFYLIQPNDIVSYVNNANVTSVALAVILFILLRAFIFTSRPPGFPPGPDGLPVIGCLLDIILSNPFAAFKRYARKYGDVFSIKIGPFYMIICHGIRANREILVEKGQDFAGRPEIFIKAFGAGGRGIITRPCDRGLPEQKKFALRCIKCFGLEGDSMEKRVAQEADALAHNLQREEGKIFSIARYLQCGTCNVICSVAFSKRYEHSDPIFNHLLDILDEQFGVNPFQFLLQIAQLLPKPVRKRLPWLDLASPTEKIIHYIESLVAVHRLNYNPGHLSDIIDAFFDKQDKYKSGLYTDARETYESFTDDQLVYLLLDFFLAGTETTATTLNWAVLYMLRYPDVQKKVQEELDQTYGRGSNVVPTLKDKAKLTFTSATLMEIQRIRPVAPMGTPHCAVRNSELSGYSISKGSTVINDLWSVHMDEEFWEQPDKFDPNRMLDANNEVIRPVSFLPFSIGPRACLGEQLAKTELFIFFTTLLHRYEFAVPTGERPPTDEPHFGISLTPKPYKVSIKPRY